LEKTLLYLAWGYLLPVINIMNFKILLTNFVGQEVAKLSIESNKISWDCSNQEPGIYFYSYYLKGRAMSGKMVVIR
jgi:hypothetical protein